MAQEFFSLVEDNDFGVEVVQDLNSIHNEQCPLPPVLDYQLDVLMIVEMAKDERRTFEKVQEDDRIPQPARLVRVIPHQLCATLEYSIRVPLAGEMVENALPYGEPLPKSIIMALPSEEPFPNRAKTTPSVKPTAPFPTDSCSDTAFRRRTLYLTSDTA